MITRILTILLLTFSWAWVKAQVSEDAYFDSMYKAGLTIQILANSEDFTLLHFHDHFLPKTRYFLLRKDTDLGEFSDSNNYSRLVLIHTASNDTLFSIPTQPFTHIEITPDQKHLICLSDYMVLNNIMVMSMKGEVLLRHHLAPIYVKFRREQLCGFRDTFPEVYNAAAKAGYIEKYKGHYFYDIIASMKTLENNSGDTLYDYLRKYGKAGHPTARIGFSTGCYGGHASLLFYDQEEPNPVLKKALLGYYKLKLRDHNGDFYTIRFKPFKKPECKT